MYNIDIRKLCLQVYKFTNSMRKTSILLNISISSISRWNRNLLRKTYHRLSNKSINAILIFQNIVKNNPLITLRELKSIIFKQLHISCSIQLLRLIIKKHGYSRKKIKFYGETHNQKTKTTDFIHYRNLYMSQGYKFYSLDEVSFNRNTKPTYGYSKIGHPIHIKKYKPRITTTSYMVLIDEQNIVKKQKSTKPFNTHSFQEFISSCHLPPKSIILLDNVSFHHSKVIKTILEQKHFKFLFTPPYSPWFNPIEGIFSIIKRRFYKNMNIEESFQNIDPSIFKSFFKKSLNCIQI